MATINSVNDLVGFDQYLYDYMKTSYIKSTGKTESDFEALVLSVSDNGKLSFMDVVDEIRDLLPQAHRNPQCFLSGSRALLRQQLSGPDYRAFLGTAPSECRNARHADRRNGFQD